MPVTPEFSWEQSLLDVTITANIKGFKKDAIDVFISDVYVKVNAAPTYLLSLDLLKPVHVNKSTFRVDHGGLVKIVLPKVEEEEWETLVVDKKQFLSNTEARVLRSKIEKKLKSLKRNKQTAAGSGRSVKFVDPTTDKATSLAAKSRSDRVEELPSDDEGDGDQQQLTFRGEVLGDDALMNKNWDEEELTLNDRRQQATARAERLYNMKLTTREQQKEAEKKRFQHEQWEIEKRQREEIIAKVRREKEEEKQKLAEWQEKERLQAAANAAKKIASPADVAFIAAASSQADDGTGIRGGGETVSHSIDFTPKSMSAPTRSRGDAEFYRRSRYKPVSIEDSPMYWKEKADAFYKQNRFQDAADAYTESVKRDGCSLSCVSNRAACFIRLHDYKRAIEDCDLALTLLANTPASETTQERYKYLMMKLHARRGAARCWDGQFTTGVEDLRMAAAYRHGIDEEATSDGGSTSGSKCTDLVADLSTVEDFMKRKGIVEERDPASLVAMEASRHYYSGQYGKSAEVYQQVLALNEFDVKARSNLCATFLQMGLFKEALVEAQRIMDFCAEVASALAEPGAQTSVVGADSDDEDECEDELIAKKQAAAKKIGERSGHVYLLLKAYVRAAAAHAGLKDLRKAYDYMEKALRITPFDDDLREDANRILEKLKMDTLIGASGAANAVRAA